MFVLTCLILGHGPSMVEGIECWPCNPRVSGSISGTGNLKKLLIWMKIHTNYKTLFISPSRHRVTMSAAVCLVHVSHKQCERHTFAKRKSSNRVIDLGFVS